MTKTDVEVANLSYAFQHAEDHHASMRILRALLALITEGGEETAEEAGG